MIKSLVYASLSLLGVLATVITLSILLCSVLKDIEKRVDESINVHEINCTEAADKFRDIESEFSTKLPLLSLLVSDTALLEIERGFSDVISYADAECEDEVAASVQRLALSLEHLREIAGLSIKSMF